jgi:hypothetical protein
LEVLEFRATSQLDALVWAHCESSFRSDTLCCAVLSRFGSLALIATVAVLVALVVVVAAAGFGVSTAVVVGVVVLLFVAIVISIRGAPP